MVLSPHVDMHPYEIRTGYIYMMLASYLEPEISHSHLIPAHFVYSSTHKPTLSLSLTLSRILVHSFAYSGIKMWIQVCHETFETITYLQRQLFIFQCVILRLISSIRFSVVL